MPNQLQINRYKTLHHYLEQHFKEDIKIKDIEQIALYSYRNINRIFLALEGETIGQYIKRLRLEKAAEYLKYSDMTVSDITFEVGYQDIAAFSKAFKLRFKVNPSGYRQIAEDQVQTFKEQKSDLIQPIDYTIEELPDLQVLSCCFKGSYEDETGMERTWESLINYVSEKQLLNENSILLAEILDDNEISADIHCRYCPGLVLHRPLSFEPEQFFRTKLIPRSTYVKFVHQGSHQSATETYNRIYATWINSIDLPFGDTPSLEFYLNFEEDSPEKQITEIYIPVQK